MESEERIRELCAKAVSEDNIEKSQSLLRALRDAIHDYCEGVKSIIRPSISPFRDSAGSLPRKWMVVEKLRESPRLTTPRLASSSVAKWQSIAQELAEETDPGRILSLCEALNDAMDAGGVPGKTTRPILASEPERQAS
jgi:hypothetical protein